MKKLMLSLAIAFVVLSATAQKNYQPGFIFKDGKIEQGKIATPTVNIDKSFCFFMNKNGEKIKYTPKEISGYRFENGRFFESIEIDKNQLFAEKILDGQISLYLILIEEQKTFWLWKNEEGLVELVNSMIEIRNDEGTLVGLREKKEYTGILKTFMSETIELNQKINETRLTEKDLISIINKYHKIVCPDNMCQVYKKKFELKLFIGPEIRVNHSDLTFDFTKNFTNRFSNRTFTNSNSISVGLNINTSGSNDYMKTLMPGLGVFYNANTYYSPRKPGANENADELDLFEIKTKSIHIPLSLSYILSPTKAFTPCFGAGLSYELFLQNNFAEYLGPMVTDRVKETHTANGKINFFANAGFRYALNKHWVLDSRISYQQGGGIVSSLANSWDSKIKNISLNVSVQYQLSSKGK